MDAINPQPATAVPRVLSQADCAKLNKLMLSCNSTACLLDALKQLGLDVSSQEADNAWQARFAAQCKATFFPDQP